MTSKTEGEMVERLVRSIAKHQDQGWLFSEDAVSLLDPERVQKRLNKLRYAALDAIRIVREFENEQA